MNSNQNQRGLVQLLGIGESPILLSPQQLKGDTNLLQSQPEQVLLYIRAPPQAKTKEQAVTETGGPSESWHLFVGRQLPDALKASPTYYMEKVYSCLQHAFFALMLQHQRVAHVFYPRGVQAFPHVELPNTTQAVSCRGRSHPVNALVGLPVGEPRGLALQLLSHVGFDRLDVVEAFL